jgi:hypothetical protein
LIEREVPTKLIEREVPMKFEREVAKNSAKTGAKTDLTAWSERKKKRRKLKN